MSVVVWKKGFNILLRPLHVMTIKHTYVGCKNSGNYYMAAKELRVSCSSSLMFNQDIGVPKVELHKNHALVTSRLRLLLCPLYGTALEDLEVDVSE